MAEVKNSKPKPEIPRDWKSEHLQWLEETPHFVPYGGDSYSGSGVTYAQTLSSLYYAYHEVEPCSQEIAKILYEGDKKHYDTMHRRVREVKSECTLNKNFRVFCTINCVNSWTNYDAMIKLVRHIYKAKWCCEGSAVLEFHRDGGIHPHIHIDVECFRGTKMNVPSDVGDRIWKILKGKPYEGMVLAYNFISHKYSNPNTDKYVNGDKQKSKLPLVQKDIEFRNLHQIPHLINS